MAAVGSIIAANEITKGGPIILVQVQYLVLTESHCAAANDRMRTV